jgi:hypothetical protein
LGTFSGWRSTAAKLLDDLEEQVALVELGDLIAELELVNDDLPRALGRSP